MPSLDANIKNPDAVAFDRLHALVGRGYRPVFDAPDVNEGLERIELRHPKVRTEHAPPPLTLWSNGIISTSAILWPRQAVMSDDSPPLWQKFIDYPDRSCFERFVSEVPRPNFYDLYVQPAIKAAKVFSFMMLFAFGLCTAVALAFKLGNALLFPAA